MRVLITGGSGFVGLAVADVLLGAGHDVALLADREPPACLLAALPRAAPLLLADVRDADAVRAAFEHARPTHLVHAAALTPSPVQEVTRAAATMAVNVAGVATVLAEAARAGVTKTVLTSSVAVYGPAPVGATLDEGVRPAPASLYGVSKAAAEMTASRMADVLGLDLVIARLGPVFGPFEHETGARGLMSPQRQVLRAARAGEPVRLPWPLATDWIFSRDAGEAVLSLLLAGRLSDRIFNVGAGAVTNVLQWAARLAPMFPTLDARVAGPAEIPTVSWAMTAERAPMAVDRLAAATGWRATHDLPAAVASLRARPDAWAP